MIRSVFALIALVFLPLTAVAQSSQSPLDLKVEYSADSTVGTGPNARPGKLWRTPVALRHETTEQGQAQIVIVRFDRKVAWLALPGIQTAIETDVSALGGLAGALGGDGSIKPQPAGIETIDGVRTTRYRIDANDPKAGRFNGFVWSNYQGVVLKIEGEGEHAGRRGLVALRFHNIQTGKQDVAMFEPPANFRRVKATPEQVETMVKGLEQMQRLMGGGR